MSAWHRPDVETAALDYLTQAVGDKTGAQQILHGLREKAAAEQAAEVRTLRERVAELDTAALVTEYQVPVSDSEWVMVRREPQGDRWAILASRRTGGERRAYVGGRWQVLPVVGPDGLWEYDSAETALAVATGLAVGGERP
ncbi:hypothetical protein [Streptomyces sp. NRRL F-5123]|uniref:hypothetical protein n=1 Tax=Streptomyces sp. NRRL F-5123 TaxID=1463856 RepID=UPI0004E262CF|nr:hypothetical protein [Streptomyces sp. NRRL F-5123]